SGGSDAAQAAALSTKTALELTRVVTTALLTTSDASTNRLASDSLVKGYFDQPRLILVSHRVTFDTAAQTLHQILQIDLRRDTIRALSFPGQAAASARAFAALRGVAESVLEAKLPAALAPPSPVLFQNTSAAAVLAAAVTQSVPLSLITSS